MAIELASNRLLDGQAKQRCEKYAGDADHKKGPSPADHAGDDTAKHYAQRAANGNTKGVDTHRPCALIRRKVVGDQGIGRSDATGFSNTASGFQALSANVDGHDNTVIGAWARANNSRGSGNLILGAFDGINDNGVGSNNIIVAHTGVLDDDVTTRIGEMQTRAFIAGIQGVTTGINDAVNVVIDSNGQLGTISSSRRYKEDINDMGSASDRLLQLHPVTFRYKESYANGEQPMDFGLIAEEVAEVFPDLVVFNAEGQPETVKYRLLSSLLLNEVQKQHSTLSGQVAEIDGLKDQLAELRQQVSRIATNQSSGN